MSINQGDILTYNGTAWINQPWVQLSFGVGIAPAYQFHASLGGASFYFTEQSGTGIAGLQCATSQQWSLRTVNTSGRFDVRDDTVGAERISISTPAGNVGIGQTSPTYGLHQLGGGARLQSLAAAGAPTVTVVGAAGATSYTYYVVAKDRNGKRTPVSPATTITTGNATLNSTNYNTISWTAVSGAASYDVLKTNTGTSLAVGTTATSVNDQGQTTAAYTPPVRNETADAVVDGFFGIATASPDTLVHVTAADSTNSNLFGLKLQRTTTNTPAQAGLGVGIQFIGQTSGGAAQEIGNIQCVENNLSSFGAFLSFNIVSGGSTQEILRLRAFGSQGTIGQISCAAPIGGLNCAPQLTRNAISMSSDADLTLTATQYQGFILEVSSSVSLTATRKVILPLTDGGTWHVFNNTTGAQQLNFIGASGTGTAVGNGKRAIIYTDGTNVVRLTPDT